MYNLPAEVRSASPDTDIIVIKIDTDVYNIEETRNIHNMVKESLPQYKIVTIPSGITLEVKFIDDLIQYLQEIKDGLNDKIVC